MNKDIRKRLVIGVSAPVMLVLLCIYEYQGGEGMECIFYRRTGLYCPGCGSGRAVSALFHGRLIEAVSYNILLPLLGIPCVFVLLHEYLRSVFPGLKLRPVEVSQKTVGLLAAVILIFWLLRNLPGFDFLAP